MEPPEKPGRFTRTDIFLSGSNNLAETVRRGQRYAEAGADMFFAPEMSNLEDIATLVSEVPVKVNVYAGPGVPSVAELADVGVGRLSVGCGILQSALASARRETRKLYETGSYEFSENWLPFEDLEALCVE